MLGDQTCDSNYIVCNDVIPCYAHLCKNSGLTPLCGYSNSPPDKTIIKDGKPLYYFCAATASGDHPVDRSFFDVQMELKDSASPYCCIKPKTPHLICHNNGTNNDDGSCDCSTAVETLTDCSHSGGIGNNTYNSYSGSGSGSDGRPGGNSFTVQYTGEACEIPGKLPDNFVKWFNHNVNHGQVVNSCQVNRDCLGDTTQCVEDNYHCNGWIDDQCSNNGTICGTNINGLDHKCTT